MDTFVANGFTYKVTKQDDKYVYGSKMTTDGKCVRGRPSKFLMADIVPSTATTQSEVEAASAADDLSELGTDSSESQMEMPFLQEGDLQL